MVCGKKMKKPEVKDGWIVGWKDIARYIGCSHRTAKRWHKIHSIPIYRLPSNKPVAVKYMLDQWLIEYNRIKKEILI